MLIFILCNTDLMGFFFCLCRFKNSNNDHVIEVNLYDDIDFVCPHYPGQTDPNRKPEYYVINQVTAHFNHLFKIMLVQVIMIMLLNLHYFIHLVNWGGGATI